MRLGRLPTLWLGLGPCERQAGPGIPRQLGTTTLAALGLLLSVFCAGATAASEIELQLEGGENVKISRVVISNGRGSLSVEVAAGLMRQVQNSIQLSGIPSLNDLTQNQYPSDALGANSRIGAVWRDGDLLFVVVDEPLVRLRTIESVTLFNDRWRYRLLDRTQDFDLDLTKDIPRFGGLPTVQRWLRLLPEPDDVRLLTIGTRRSPVGLLSPGARARADVEALSTFFVGSAHRSQNQLGIVIYPSDAAN